MSDKDELEYQKLELLISFNYFIKKWCGSMSAHLMDSDENDGEDFRNRIRKLGVNKNYKEKRLGLIPENIEKELLSVFSGNPVRNYDKGFWDGVKYCVYVLKSRMECSSCSDIFDHNLYKKELWDELEKKGLRRRKEDE